MNQNLSPLRVAAPAFVKKNFEYSTVHSANLQAADRPIVILRLPEFLRRMGIKKSMYYEKRLSTSKYFDPSMPRAIKLGANSVGFAEHEVEAWILIQMAKRDLKGSN